MVVNRLQFELPLLIHEFLDWSLALLIFSDILFQYYKMYVQLLPVGSYWKTNNMYGRYYKFITDVIVEKTVIQGTTSTQ